ncbi:MAG: beta-phosphoglucomutase [Candidatus Izimaplasma sp.]|nr:beta-phosphoglucomutase [Candidatus Izimaplasma bacterium]
MIKGVIFDLDGVIVSTDNLHYKAWKKMADKENIEFNKQINNRLRGISRKASLEIILEKAKKDYTDVQKKELTDYKNTYYRQLLETLTKDDILPGITDILNTLQENNIKIAIGSSSKNAKKILKKIELYNQFAAITDGTNITQSKPHPEVFLIAAKKLDLLPINLAVVEDAKSGILAAKKAHMTAFATGNAKNSQEKDYDFEQLIDVVLQD